MKEKISRVRVAIVTVMLMVSFGIVLSGGNTDIAKAASKKPKLNKTKIELTKGDTFKLKLSNAKNVKWSSNKKTVATVNKKGKVTAKKKGNAVISAKYLKRIYKCKVKVVNKKTKTNETSQNQIKVQSISLDKTNIELDVGGKDNITATILPGNATNKSVTWTSSNTNIVNVDCNGVITAITPGTASISATCDGISAICNVVVNDYYVTAISSNDIEFIVNKIDDYRVSVIVKNKTNTDIKIGDHVAALSSIGSYNDTLYFSERGLFNNDNRYVNDYTIKPNEQFNMELSDGYYDTEDKVSYGMLVFDIMYNNITYHVTATNDGSIIYNNESVSYKTYFNKLAAYGIACAKENLKNPNSFVINRMGYTKIGDSKDLKIVIEFYSQNSYGATVINYAFINRASFIFPHTNKHNVLTNDMGCIECFITDGTYTWKDITFVNEYSGIIDIANELYMKRQYKNVG